MAVAEVLELDAFALRHRYAARQLSPVEVLDAVARRIEEIDPELNAFTTVCLDRTRAEAERAERNFADGSAGALEGIPIAVKDLFDTAGVRTTYGSAIYAANLPDADAEAVRLVREAGAILVGKTSTHEFAWGITAENPHYGACHNPWDPERVSGGSSGGSAVALAARAVPLALGTDTGGSIRIPAAFCGVVGLKPSFGRVSADGVFPLARSLDHVGPMARRPRDAGLLLSVLAGGTRRAHAVGAGSPQPDPLAGERRAESGEGALDGATVGICPDLNGAEPTAEVERALADALATMQGLGAGAVELELEERELIGPTFAIVQRSEALDAHRSRGLFPARAAEYGGDVRGRLELALEIEPRNYLDAAADRARLGAALGGLFGEADLLLTPVVAGPPALIGNVAAYRHRGREVDFRTVAMSTTMAQNLAGLPACVLRGGFDSVGLPIGVQLTGPAGSEDRIIAAAEALFEATPAIQQRWPDPAPGGGTSPPAV